MSCFRIFERELVPAIPGNGSFTSHSTDQLDEPAAEKRKGRAMSVRVIFSLEFAEQLKESHDSNGNPFRSFKGVRISVDPDAIYGYLGSDVENVTMNPLFPSEFITGFSARVYVITSYLRTMGRYEFVTAVGYVSDTSKGTPGGRSPGYWLNIEASSLEDLKSLYDQILAGTIRPTVSYEAEQIGPAKSWLQALYHRFVPRSA